MKATQLYRKHNGENSVTSPGKVNGRVSAAERTKLHQACLAAEQSQHKPCQLCCLRCFAARCVLPIVGLEDLECVPGGPVSINN